MSWRRFGRSSATASNATLSSRRNRPSANRSKQQIQQARSRHAERLRELHRDAANYRLMQKGEPPKAKTAFERIEELRSKPTPQASAEFQKTQGREPLSPKERVERLRKKGPERPPEPDLER
jgi:hypothetical protein